VSRIDARDSSPGRRASPANDDPVRRLSSWTLKDATWLADGPGMHPVLRCLSPDNPRVLISSDVAGRFLLGRQGLWPGRRWRDLRGTEQAMRAMEHLQLDPLQVIARAQDLALQSRVIDYHQDDWAKLTYEKRRFFEWGGWLAVRPIDELPFYRVVMRRSRDLGRIKAMGEAHAGAIEEMRALLRDGRELSNRDFAMGARTRVNSYRGRKDSALALYYLWRTGEAMVTRRERFERVYARSEAVAPHRYLYDAPEPEAEDRLLLNEVAAAGFSRLPSATWIVHRDLPAKELERWKQARIGDGDLIELDIEGFQKPHVALAADAPALEALAAGRTPRAWKPAGPTTTEEATFLSPLDPVIADRERARRLFGFDYKWEVYNKAEQRRFGYYVLPILWGDRLVGRFDSKLDRSTMTYVISGLWLEDDALAGDDAFVEALRAGMSRFLGFLGAAAIGVRGVQQAGLRRALSEATAEPLAAAT
jgi:hypothetical protein